MRLNQVALFFEGGGVAILRRLFLYERVAMERMPIPSSMHALLLTDDGPILRNDYHTPKPQPGEAQIRVHLAGICSTDLQLLAGYKGGYRGVLGHEFVGTVVDAPGAEFWIGRRVVGEINIGCGHCSLCARGLHKHCRQRQSMGIIGRDGAFADYLTLPIANLHIVPEGISDEQAVFVEPLAAAMQILEQIHLTPETRLYLLGVGRLGLLAAQVLASTNCDLVALVRNDSRIGILSELGIPTIHLGSPEADALQDPAADVVVDTSGSPSGFELAQHLVRPGGTIVLKSTFAGRLSQFDISSLVVHEVTLVGSRCGPFAPALRALERGAVRVQPLIQHRLPLADGVDGLAIASRPGVLKVLLAPFAGTL